MDSLENYGVYCILTPRGKAYVGMTTQSFYSRWYNHLKELKNGRHKTTGLKNAYSKYGIEGFTFTILEEWDSINNKLEMAEDILLREKYWWEKLNSEGLVMLHGCPTGTGSVLHSKDTIKKISAASSSKAHPPVTKKCAWDQCANEFTVPYKRRFKKNFCCSECRLNNQRKIFPNTVEQIRKLYLEDNMTLGEIGELLNMSSVTVFHSLKAQGVERRARGFKRID